MKLLDLITEQSLDEVIPALGTIAGGAARGVASMIGGAMGATQAPAAPGIPGVNSSPPQDPQAAQKAQAMAVKQIQDQKKEIQTQITAKEKEIQELRKKLAELG